jgi:DNA repair exonuclease SbcCD ATPase subunit
LLSAFLFGNIGLQRARLEVSNLPKQELTMNKSRIIMMLFSIAIVVFCINAHADNTSQQIAALQQKAELIKNQINQAQSQCGSGSGVESQLKSMASSIESLVQQRAQLGAHISRLESQVEELKNSSRASCARTVKQHEDELNAVKQEIVGLTAKQKAETVQNAPAPTAPSTVPALPAAGTEKSK